MKKKLFKKRSSKPDLIFLKGQRINLRPLKSNDAYGPYVQWLNDELVCRFNSHHVYPFTRVDARKYIEAVGKNKSVIVLAVETLKGRRHIGNIALKNIDHFSKCSELAILIGNPAYWSKGYGEEASRLLLQHGFTALGLNRIYAGTYAENTGMRRLAERLGMKEEGVRRQAAFKNGKFSDIIEFGVLGHEFKSH